MKKKAIYPGTFDPMTNGHLNIIIRSMKIIDKLIIGVADNLNKTPLLSIKERIDIITKDLNYEFQDNKNYLGISAAMYENLSSNDSDKTRFEYSVPNILFERNLFTGDKIGVFDIKSLSLIHISEPTRPY